MRTSLLTSFVLVLAAVAGCGGGAAFGPTYPDNRESDLSAVTSRLESAAPVEASALAVGVATSPAGVYAYDLSGARLLWNEPADLGTVPHVAGDFVVTEEGDDVVVRSLSTGRITARQGRRGLRLVGAAGEGADGCYVLSTTGGAVAESALVLIAGGSPSSRFDVDQALGEPAVRAGMVFIPWGHQNVSVIDHASGAELARLRVRQVVGHAVAHGRAVYIGQDALARFSADLLADPAWLEPSEAERSSGATLFDDAYAPPPAAASAAHHVRMAFAPAPNEVNSGVTFEGDALYEVFYRAVFSLEGTGGTARWASLTRSDVVGAAVEGEGIFVADESGHITFLDAADGRPRWSVETGVPSSYVALRVAGFSPAGSPSGDVLPLRDQLLSVAADTDGRLVPARAFAVRLLGALPEAEVTENLIALCEDRRAAPSVHQAACETLGARTLGSAAVLGALGRHERFLEGTSAPPVGPLSSAAFAMGERGAVPLLVQHLSDPGTPAADLPALLRALGAFGDTTVLEPLAEWLRLYHAEPDDSDVSDALGEGARAYGTLAGPTAGEVLQPLLDDPMTNARLREAATAVLAPPDAEADTTETDEPLPEASAPTIERRTGREAMSTVAMRTDDGGAATLSDAPPPAIPPTEERPTLVRPSLPPVDAATAGRFAAEEARERAVAERAAAARAAAAAPEDGELEDDELPPHLTAAMVTEALSDFRIPLRECLVTDRLTHGRARVVLVIEPTGALAMVHVTPTELQSCVEPLVRSTSYPATSALRRQTVTFEIRR